MDWVNPETAAQNILAHQNTCFLLETGALSQAPAPGPRAAAAGRLQRLSWTDEAEDRPRARTSDLSPEGH